MIISRNLKRDSALLTGGHILQTAVAFAVNLILVRFISPEQFGSFALAFAEAGLIFSFFSVRINFIIIRTPVAKFDDNLQDIFFSVSIIETFIATCIIFLWFGFNGSLDFWNLLIIGSLALRHWSTLNKSFFERSMPYRELAVVETGSALFGHLVAFFVVLLGGGWIALFLREAFYSIAGTIGLRYVGGLTLRKFRMLTLEELKTIYKETRGVWLDGLLEGTFQRMTIILAGHLCGLTVTGYLAQAQRLATVPHQILTTFVNRIIVNVFSRIEERETRVYIRNKTIVILLILLIAISPIIYLYSNPMIIWLFGQEWEPVGTMLILMIGYTISLSPFEAVRSYCISAKHARKLLIGRFMQHLAFLGPLAIGAAGIINYENALPLGFSAGYLLSFFLMLYLLHREERKW